jgi:hypothetical protein
MHARQIRVFQKAIIELVTVREPSPAFDYFVVTSQLLDGRNLRCLLLMEGRPESGVRVSIAHDDVFEDPPAHVGNFNLISRYPDILARPQPDPEYLWQDNLVISWPVHGHVEPEVVWGQQLAVNPQGESARPIGGGLLR